MGGVSPRSSLGQRWSAGSDAGASASVASTTPPGKACTPGKATLLCRPIMSTENGASTGAASRSRSTVLEGNGAAGVVSLIGDPGHHRPRVPASQFVAAGSGDPVDAISFVWLGCAGRAAAPFDRLDGVPPLRRVHLLDFLGGCRAGFALSRRRRGRLESRSLAGTDAVGHGETSQFNVGIPRQNLRRRAGVTQTPC